MLCGNYTLNELVITTIFTITTLYIVEDVGIADSVMLLCYIYPLFILL